MNSVPTAPRLRTDAESPRKGVLRTDAENFLPTVKELRARRLALGTKLDRALRRREPKAADHERDVVEHRFLGEQIRRRVEHRLHNRPAEAATHALTVHLTPTQARLVGEMMAYDKYSRTEAYLVKIIRESVTVFLRDVGHLDEWEAEARFDGGRQLRRT